MARLNWAACRLMDFVVTGEASRDERHELIEEGAWSIRPDDG
jgi:hypothetical protein